MEEQLGFEFPTAREPSVDTPVGPAFALGDAERGPRLLPSLAAWRDGSSAGSLSTALSRLWGWWASAARVPADVLIGKLIAETPLELERTDAVRVMNLHRANGREAIGYLLLGKRISSRRR